jgi:hypothetical protein
VGQYQALPQASNAVVEVGISASAIKTLLQVKPVTKDLIVCAWHISVDGSASGAAIPVELIDTDVAATVTTLTPTPWDNEDRVAALAVGGTTATGYNASAEGTITASRLLDAVEIPPLGGIYTHWFPQGERPKLAAGRFLRIRAGIAAVAVNSIPWIIFDEV